MKKLTRKTFSRKFVAIGLSAFLGVGLVSTGFAAWVMSSNATNETESNVTVATLSDVSMSFKDVAIKDDKSIVFGAEANDREGRLISDGKDDACLSIVITGTITSANQLGELSAILELPTAVQSAVNAGYLVAPDTSKSSVILYTPAAEGTQAYQHPDLTSYVYDSASDTATFSYTLKFAWGEKFQSLNPSVYYDTDFTGKSYYVDGVKQDGYDPSKIGVEANYPVLGKAVSNENMTTQMQDFRALLAGTAESSELKMHSYKLTLSALSKSSV